MSACPAAHHEQRLPTEPGMVLCGGEREDKYGRVEWYGCIGRLRADLLAMELVLPELEYLLIAPAPDDGNDRRAARTDAPAPCRLDVLDLRDDRSDTPALAHIALWVANVVDGRKLSTLPADPAAQVRLMFTHLLWIAAHPTAAECARHLHQARVWLDQRAGMTETPMFTCPIVHPGAEGECGGPVFMQRAEFGVRCARCGSVWDGHERLEWLGRIAGEEGAAHA